MARPLRVLQLSDVHFDARLTAGKLGLGEEKARLRERERKEAFAKAFDLVLREDLDGVLLPGDLFDDESVSTDTLRFVAEQFARVAPKPVFLAPGNHDPYGGASPYNPQGGGKARGLRWPENLRLFAHEDFRTVAWPGRPEVSVTGCGVAANVASDARRLRRPIERPVAKLPLLLFHGSRDDGRWLQAHKSTYPFAVDELRAQRFHWTALGHYHGHQILPWEDGQPMGAYSGCLLAGGLDETGAKGALLVSMGDGRPLQVDFVQLDPRQVRAVKCDLSGVGHSEDARARVRAALDAADCRQADLVHLKLVGRRAVGLDLSFLVDLEEDFFHLRVDLSALVPDVDLDAYPPLEQARTTEQRFVARLRASIDAGDPAQAERARRALLYGLDALKRGRLDTRYEA